LVEFERQIMRIEGVSNRLERNFGSDYRTDRDMTSGMMRAAIDSLRMERQRLITGDSAGAPVGVTDDRLDDELPVDDEEATASLSEAISAEFDEVARTAMEAEVAASQALPPPSPAADSAPMTRADSAVAVASQRFVQSRIGALEYQIREYQLE